MRIEGTVTETGQDAVLKFLSLAGKSTGKFKSCYNYKNETDRTTGWIDVNTDIQNWHEVNQNEEILIT